jgi:hypothetical protein
METASIFLLRISYHGDLPIALYTVTMIGTAVSGASREPTRLWFVNLFVLVGSLCINHFERLIVDHVRCIADNMSRDSGGIEGGSSFVRKVSKRI